MIIKTLLLTLVVFFTLSCGNTDKDKVITSYSNDISSFTLPTESTLQINIFANYDDGSKENVSDSLVWLSSDSHVTVVNGLLSTTLSTGSVTISYETKEKLSDGSVAHKNSFVFDVKSLRLLSVSLSKASLNIEVGATQKLIAYGLYDDNVTRDITNSSVWLSSDTGIATVSLGAVEGVNKGDANITATKDAFISSPALASVTKTTYRSLSLSASKTEFNVEQTIVLTATATTDTNESVELNTSLITWSSSDVNIVEIVDGIATAVGKGDVNITGTITSDITISDVIELSVKKDQYMRLFKDGVEIEFPYVDINTTSTIPATLSSFTMRAIGKDITVFTLFVSDFNGNLLDVNQAYFKTLNSGDIVVQDTNVTFELISNGLQSQIHYFFKINDDFNSQFSQKYLKN